MNRSLRRRVPLPVFGLCLVAIYGVALALAPRLDGLERPEPVAAALTLGLTLLVPLLYFVLLAWPRGWPVVTVFPVFIASVLIAGRVIPETHHRVLDLMKYGLVAAEIAIVVVLAYKAVQLRRAYREEARSEHDVYAALRESAQSVLGVVAGNLLAYEMAVFYYLIFGWRRTPKNQPRSFSYHRSSVYLPIVGVVLLVACAELGGMHLLISRWSPTAAWIVTALSVYAFLWILGDANAVRLRPIRIAGSTLEIRVGLRTTIDVPLASIEKVGAPGEPGSRHTPEYLKALLLGAPNFRVKLREAVEAGGPYGLAMMASTIDLRVDDPHGLETALREATALPEASGPV